MQYMEIFEIFPRLIIKLMRMIMIPAMNKMILNPCMIVLFKVEEKVLIDSFLLPMLD